MLSRFLVSFPVPMFVCWSIIHTVGGFINRGSLAVYAYLVVSVIVFVNCFGFFLALTFLFSMLVWKGLVSSVHFGFVC